MVSTFIKRSFLRLAKQNAGTLGIYSCLTRWLSGAGINVVGSRIRTSTSADGVGVGFTLDTAGQVKSQADVLELVSELLDRWDRALASLQSAAPTASIGEDAVYNLLMIDDPSNPAYDPQHSLRAIRGTTANWMFLAK